MTHKLKAKYFLDQFEYKEGKAYIKEERDEKLFDLCYEIHSAFDAMPNDTIYSMISNAFELISEIDDIDERNEVMDSYIPVYTYDLLKYLGTPSARDFFNQAIEEFESKDFDQICMQAYWLQFDNVLGNVISFIEEHEVEGE